MKSRNERSPEQGGPARGIGYDTGMEIGGIQTRPAFDADLARREMTVIAGDLGADTVRVTGDDLDRLTAAAEAAHAAGLTVWFSPFPCDLDADGLAGYLRAAAARAEELRRGKVSVVLVLGCEFTLHAAGFLPGDTYFDRVPLLGSAPPDVLHRANERADAVHGRITAAARREFTGPITYAAGLWEDVDWHRYDRVSVNAYRDAGNAATFRQVLRAYRRWGKPVSVTEFGCCTYAGAADRGPAGFLALDTTQTPPRIRPGIRRDEQEQARYLTRTWDIFAEESIDDAFWFTFAGYALPHRPGIPAEDLDMASFGLVAITSKPGTRYPDMPWRPKAAFWAAQQAFTGR